MRCFLLLAVAAAAVMIFSPDVRAQANLPIYTDHRVNGFDDWSWGPRNFANSSPVHSGGYSISSSSIYWDALSFHHPDFNATIYSNLVFWAHGGTTGGQKVQIYAEYGTNTAPVYPLSALAANTWQQFVIPLSTLGVANATNLNRLTFQLTSSGSAATFYLDDIQLSPRPAPALV